MKRTDDETLVQALRLLARDIVSEDGIAQSTILEAADRIESKTRALRVIAIVCDPNLAKRVTKEGIYVTATSQLFDKDPQEQVQK